MSFIRSSRFAIAAHIAAMFALAGGAQAQQVSAGAQVRTAGGTVQAGATVAAPAGALAGAPMQDDRIDRRTQVQRGLTMGVTFAAGATVAEKVSGVARGAVDFGKVGGVPHWGPAVASVPIFGHAAASGKIIPTTLGQVPVMGAVVKQIPLAGPVIAGPANPVLVGAVAVDNYLIPKYSPCGYTKSSVIAATNDFNSAPKLRSYVNYLAPLPYSHPPIYSPSTLKTDLPADLAYIDQISHAAIDDTVHVPAM